MVNVSVVCDDLLDDRGTNLWLRSWRWGWRRRGWRGRRSGCSLLLAADDDLVSYDFAVVLGRRLGTWTADDKLLALPSDQIAAVARWGRETPLAVSNRQGAPLSAGVPAIAAEFSAVCAELEVTVTLLEADRASFSRDVPAVAADFAARGVEVDVVSTAAPEAHIIVVHLTRGGSADRSHRGAIATAEDDVVALWRATGLLAALDGNVRLVNIVCSSAARRGLAVTDADVVPLHAPHSRGRRRGTAPSRAHIVVEAAAAAAGSCSRIVVLIAASQNHGASSRAVVVLAEEVGGTASGVRASAAAQLEVKLLVVAIAAVSIAVEVALSLLIELSGWVASRRHCAAKRQVSDGRGVWWWGDVPLSQETADGLEEGTRASWYGKGKRDGYQGKQKNGLVPWPDVIEKAGPVDSPARVVGFEQDQGRALSRSFAMT
jgi:hypothetical protein